MSFIIINPSFHLFKTKLPKNQTYFTMDKKDETSASKIHFPQKKRTFANNTASANRFSPFFYLNRGTNDLLIRHTFI